MTERNIFDRCREGLEACGKPCYVGVMTTGGHISLLYAYTEDQKGQERLLFCGVDDFGQLVPNQILGIRNKGEQDKYYRVQWPHKLKMDGSPVINRRPEGDLIDPRLLVNMKTAIRSEVNRADLVAGYVPLEEKEAKKISTI